MRRGTNFNDPGKGRDSLPLPRANRGIGRPHLIRRKEDKGDPLDQFSFRQSVSFKGSAKLSLLVRCRGCMLDVEKNKRYQSAEHAVPGKQGTQIYISSPFSFKSLFWKYNRTSPQQKSKHQIRSSQRQPSKSSQKCTPRVLSSRYLPPPSWVRLWLLRTTLLSIYFSWDLTMTQGIRTKLRLLDLSLPL